MNGHSGIAITTTPRNSMTVEPLEIDNNNDEQNDNYEEEMDSLMEETMMDGSNNNTLLLGDTSNQRSKIRQQHQQLNNSSTGSNHLHKRVGWNFGTDDDDDTTPMLSNNNNNGTGPIPGLLRGGGNSSKAIRNVCILIVLGLISIVFLFDIRHVIIQRKKSDKAVVMKQPPPLYRPHAPSLGGIQNSAQYNQDMFTRTKDSNDDYYFDDDASYNEYYNDLHSNRFQGGTNISISKGSTTTIIPLTGFVGMPVLTSTKINRENAIGHYWHDPIHSPYSSALYLDNHLNSTNATSNQLQDIEEEEFLSKLEAVCSKYGQWEQPQWPADLIDNSGLMMEDESDIVNSPEFYYYENRDVPANEFPTYSWHLQHDYVADLLLQSKALVRRMQRGIKDEYSITATTTDDDNPFNLYLMEYSSSNANGKGQKQRGYRVDTGTGALMDVKRREPIRCGSYLTRNAYEGLVRKLLHSIITQDDFYVVAVGGSHLYKANNMFQTSIMQFQYLMEPIFDKLGVRLFSRNMGMDVSTTAINSLGGADIYGEADILWYIPDERSRSSSSDESEDGQMDLLHIQSILSGQRVPLLLTPNPGTLMSSNISKVVWMGNIQPGYEHICGKKQAEKLIETCQYIHCNNGVHHNENDEIELEVEIDEMCGGQYESVCWIERSDWNPGSAATVQDTSVGDETFGYPNPNQHKIASRKLAMLVLDALYEAIDRWETVHSDISSNNMIPNKPSDKKDEHDQNEQRQQEPEHQQEAQSVPFLPDSMWHVSGVYKEIREQVRTVRGTTACDEFLKEIDPGICHLEMHVFTEWTPRVTPGSKSLKTLVQGDITDVSTKLIELYSGIDLLPKQWKLPPGTVDAHMIAIAANTTEMQQYIKEHPLVVPSATDSSPSTIGSYKGVNDEWDDDLYVFDANDDDGWGYGVDPADLDFLSVSDSNDDTAYTNTNDNEHKLRQQRRRKLQLSVVSRTAWTVYRSPIGYCDGSSQSRCNRAVKNKCLLSNHNFYRAGLLGHANSGPLRLRVPNIREGIILVRFDWQHQAISDLPSDFQFVYRINDNIMDTTVSSFETPDHNEIVLSKTEFQKSGIRISDDFIVHKLYMNLGMSQNETMIKVIDVQIEIRTSKHRRRPLVVGDDDPLIQQVELPVELPLEVASEEFKEADDIDEHGTTAGATNNKTASKKKNTKKNKQPSTAMSAANLSTPESGNSSIPKIIASDGITSTTTGASSSENTSDKIEDFDWSTSILLTHLYYA